MVRAHFSIALSGLPGDERPEELAATHASDLALSPAQTATGLPGLRRDVLRLT